MASPSTARESLCLVGAQRRRHQCAGRRREWVRRRVEEDIEIVAGRRRRERKLALHLDALEAGGAGERDKVTVVESAEEIFVRRPPPRSASRSLR